MKRKRATEKMRKEEEEIRIVERKMKNRKEVGIDGRRSLECLVRKKEI